MIYFPSMDVWDSRSSSEGAKKYKHDSIFKEPGITKEASSTCASAPSTCSNGIIWVQLSPDVLPLTPIFLTHYKQIILLIYPVKQTEPSTICILLLLKLPNKYFSGFMDEGQFQDNFSEGTSGRGRTFVCWNPVVSLYYALPCVCEGGEEPCCNK